MADKLNIYGFVFCQGRLMEGEFNSAMDEKNVPTGVHDEEKCRKLQDTFWESLRTTFEDVLDAMQRLRLPSNDHANPDKQITSWNSFVKKLSLDDLCDKLLRTIFCAVSFIISMCCFVTCV